MNSKIFKGLVFIVIIVIFGWQTTYTSLTERHSGESKTTSTPFIKDVEKKQASQGKRKQQDWQTDSPTADKEKASKTYWKRKQRQRQKGK